MSDSTLVTVTVPSPHYRVRTAKIDTITIHHAATVGINAATLGTAFTGSRVASANYGIGNDGSIGLYVSESYRAITSSNAENDNRAVTIEVANSAGEPDWPVSDAALNSLVELCADICRRNGIKKLIWRNDPNGIGRPEWQNVTVHRFFAATACPGPFIMSHMNDIVTRTNRKLAEPLFKDTEGHWARPYIERCASEGLVNGKPDGTFAPDAGLTRAEASAMFARLLDRMEAEK